VADRDPGEQPYRPRRWSTLTVELPEEREDELVARLPVASVSGVARTGLGDGRCRLVVCLTPGADAGAVEVEARLALAACGLDPGGAAVAGGAIEDGRWVERWIAGLRPFGLGRTFAILPRGEEELPRELAGRTPIALVPGRAFGTGEHPTTQMSVEALEELVAPGSRWVDVGCGTAVLAIVAERLGADEVLALDTDPGALDVAREVLSANGASSVRIAAGSIDAVRSGAWHGVVANVSAEFARVAPMAIARVLAPGGHAVLTGFLEADRDEIEHGLDATGLALVACRARGPWIALVARRGKA
jgi:ribosomal protein L11 methyltransferase